MVVHYENRDYCVKISLFSKPFAFPYRMISLHFFFNQQKAVYLLAILCIKIARSRKNLEGAK
ncbi:MAG: hypothetical protein JETT_1094 [Candidatus Jettenia ecosi]|uniref:Uncharacterized protein n=1 Tax=Candidatus Jettenia ecosi TaxID=2494326 RepID=A0A533QPY4_9BACT|nr:MAG: hypothetical protein JETT_1094 [Candidatus Jettenia ecosi]